MDGVDLCDSRQFPGAHRSDRPWALLIIVVLAIVLSPLCVNAEHEGRIQGLLLADSTTEGSVPRRLKPEGPHLEKVLETVVKKAVNKS